MADASGAVWLDGRQLAFRGAARAIALSPDGVHALVIRDEPRTVLLWREAGAPVELEDATGTGCTAATFVARNGEMHIAILYRHELVLHRLDASVQTRQPLGGLAAWSVHPVAGGTALAVLGAEFAESRDTVAVFGVSEFPVSPAVIGRRFDFAEGLVDSANLVAVGPAGSSEVVLYRDGEGEEPLGEGDAAAIVPREWGFTGFYVATTSGETRQRIEWTAPVKRGTSLAASDSYIVAGSAKAIDLIDRRNGTHEQLALQWMSTTATGDRVLVKTAEGALQLLHL